MPVSKYRYVLCYSLIGDEAFVCGISWKGRVEHVAIFCEHVILEQTQHRGQDNQRRCKILQRCPYKLCGFALRT